VRTGAYRRDRNPAMMRDLGLRRSRRYLPLRNLAFPKSSQMVRGAGLATARSTLRPNTFRRGGNPVKANRLGHARLDDPRDVAIREALYRDVLGERSQHATSPVRHPPNGAEAP